MASTARRSSENWTLKATGRTGHSGAVFEPGIGYGAIFEAARILDEFRRTLPEPNLTYSVGLVAGGTTAQLGPGAMSGEEAGKTNVVPPVAYARGDLRALTQQQIDETKAKMQAIVAQSLPGTHAELTFDPVVYPPMPSTPGNRALLAKVNAVNRDMGLPEMGDLPPSERGAGDISFVAPYVDSLSGMGAGGGGAHAPGETVDIPSIFKQAKRTAILLTRLSHERSHKR
jgi:glutamate carboxypeptidase